MARHWSEIGEVTVAKGIRLLFLVNRILGRWPFRCLVYPTVLFYMLRHPQARRASRQYLTRVFATTPGGERPATVWQVLRHFAAFAENILDKLRIWSGDLRTEAVTFHDYHVIHDQVLAGRGGVIFVTHLGNVEVCRALITRKDGAKLTVLVHTKHAESFNAMLAEVNPASTLNTIQVTDISAATVIQLRERVDRGEYIVIACDRVPVSAETRVAHAPFLGASAPFPVGPYVLASLLQCPSYLLFCILEQGAYHMYFERFHERIVLPRASRGEALAQLASDFAARLASFCVRAPYQWFNFYDFWAPPSMEHVDTSH